MLIKIITKFFKKKSVRNIAIVASGTAGAQIIHAAFSPIITRLYGPEAFGLMGTFMAIASVVTPVAALAYPIAIVLPKHDHDAKGIARVSVYSSITITCILTLALLISGNQIITILKIQKIEPYIFLIPVAVIFAAFLQIASQWLIRKKQFAITARVSIIQSFIINIAKAGVGIINPMAAWLIIITVFGNVIHACMLYIGAKKIEKKKSKTIQTYSRSGLWKLAKKYYDFPLYRSPQMLINAFSQSLPVLMLASFFGPASAGFYALCRKLLGMPSQLIGKSVSDVFYPRIVEACHNNENITSLIIKATISLAVVGFIPFAIVIAFGPSIFSFIFGNNWVHAGEYARWLSLWMFFGFINRPSVVSIPVLKLQGFFLIYEIFSVLLRVIALTIGFYVLNDEILAILIFSLAGVFLNFSLIVITCCSDRFGIQNKRII